MTAFLWSSRVNLGGNRGASGGASPPQMPWVIWVFRAFIKRLEGHSSFLQHLQHPTPSCWRVGWWLWSLCPKESGGNPRKPWVPPSQMDFYLSKLKSPGLWKHSLCPGLAEKPCEVGKAVCAFQWLQLLRVQWGVGEHWLQNHLV